MASLTDQIDRLANNARNIKAVASGCKASTSTGPFTNAILHADLGDLIRDIDASELGLFTLITPKTANPNSNTNDMVEPEITRVEFHGATPLRKPVKKDDLQRVKEHEPEVYAHAAVKFIDRYESVRPMPRAYNQVVDILQRIEASREKIRSWTETLGQIETVEPPSVKEQFIGEEERVRSLQSRLNELRKRKEKLQQEAQNYSSQAKPKAAVSPNLSTPVKVKVAGEEDAFWNSPGLGPRALQFTEDNLLRDEHMDLADVSVEMGQSSMILNEPMASDLNPDKLHADNNNEEEINEETVTVAEEEDTAILNDAGIELHEEQRSSSPPSQPTGAETPRTKARWKVSADVEKIAAKIWSTMGDMIKPGHGYDLTGKSANKPPRAKETIAYLQGLADLTPTPQSPPTYSASISSDASGAPSQPSPQQILIAFLLTTLLSSPPDFSIPLKTIKPKLAEKAGADISNKDSSLVTVLGGTQGTTRVIYSCVAKRLIKIDRGGGEQIVKFDI